jgi:8-oxo-dGTP pyrophosphatase MutT (NUDIX family)
MNPRWTPNVTVAAVIEHHGRFLLVEEQTSEGLRLNNPAGHLEPGEHPLEAVVREVMEESAHPFTPEALVGAYLARGGSTTYLRLAYCGRVGAPVQRPLDHGIVRTLWLDVDEIRAQAGRHRSPLVQQCIDDYRAGRRFPLELLRVDPSAIG